MLRPVAGPGRPAWQAGTAVPRLLAGCPALFLWGHQLGPRCRLAHELRLGGARPVVVVVLPVCPVPRPPAAPTAGSAVHPVVPACLDGAGVLPRELRRGIRVA